MARPPSSLMSLAFALALLLTSLLGHCATASAASTASGDAMRQPLLLEGPARPPYTFGLYANADLGRLPSHVRQAVVILHGVKRNADDYFAIGQHLLTMAGLAASDNLLLAPTSWPTRTVACCRACRYGAAAPGCRASRRRGA
ncbi:hypothetical protein [Herbaspirillum frisingense]|uniref:hypothetical protein n=1 Tax=Herbaspirillum frisingense TaxID=92645 RepID=UPI001F167E59|nr:hypothetical protein [Herbaspirillum frisingense]